MRWHGDPQPDLSSAHAGLGPAGTWVEYGNRPRRAFVESTDAGWMGVGVSRLLSEQIPDGRRFFVMYGDFTGEGIEALQDEVVLPVIRRDQSDLAA